MITPQPVDVQRVGPVGAGTVPAGAVPAVPPRTPWWRRLALPVAVAAPVAAATGYVALVSPFTHHYQSCFVLSTFGVYCPGCGGVRAVHELTHGHVLAALDLNAFGTVFVVVAAALWVWWLVARVRGRALYSRLVAVVLFGLVAALPVFTVLRNLPFGRVLAP